MSQRTASLFFPRGRRPLPSAMLLSLVMLASGAHASGGYGFTFGKYGHDSILGVDHLGYGSTGNPYTGDTKCNVKRPILCTNVDGSSRPNYDVAVGQEFYQGWVQGHFATTVPVKGTSIASEAAGDQRCATSFGPGWRMAEFHDGAYVNGMSATDVGNTYGSATPWPAGPYSFGGWTQWGFGNVDPNTRYWVAINTTDGNCWNP